MKIDVKVPSVGESIKEAILVEWYKKDGEAVQKDEMLFLIETDKVTIEVLAEASGVLSVKASEGDTVAIGAVVGIIDAEAAATITEKAFPYLSAAPMRVCAKDIPIPYCKKLEGQVLPQKEDIKRAIEKLAGRESIFFQPVLAKSNYMWTECK